MQNKNYPIQRTGSQDNERYQINKVLGDVLDTLDRASDWDAAASWGDHRTANYASEEDAILSGVTVPTTITLSYERDTLPNGTDIARIRAQWTRVTNPNFVYDLEIRERDIGDTALGTLYSVPIISNTEGGSIAAYESEFKLGKNYQFRIRIRQNRVISPWSDYFDIDTARDPQAPGGPGGTSPGGPFPFNLTAEAGQASIILKWTAPTSPNLAYYEVRRTAPSPTVSPLAQIGVGNTTYTDAGLEAGVTHTYSVRAVSYEGQATAYSNNASAVPLEVEFTAPPAPTGLIASSRIVTGNTGDQVGKVLVTWDRIVGEDITYDLEIFEVPPVGSPELITSPSIVNPESLTEKPHYEFVGQVNDNFSIKVRSRRATNTSDWTTPVTISIIPDSASPGNINSGSITLSPIYQGILLKWDRPLAANYNSTRIERRFTAPVGTAYEEIGEVTRPISFFFDNIGQLDVDPTTKAVTTRVRYRLTPLSSAGQSGSSIETALGTPSNIPEGTISAGQIIANSITANEIEANTITTAELDVGQITADSAFFGGIQQNISASGEYGAIILKDGPTGPATRDNGTALRDGDLWLDTRFAEENRPYVRSGGSWIAAYTSIDGGNIKTGTIDADRLNIVAIIDENNLATTGDIPEGGNVIIRSASPPAVRPSGSPLQDGDTWIETDNGDLPYTRSGGIWVRMYTQINGGLITTGTVDADRLDVRRLTTNSSPSQRVEIADPTADATYALWIGSGAKDDTASFWVKQNGDVFINKQVFGITDGQIYSEKQTSSGAANSTTTNSAQTTFTSFTHSGADVVVDASISYYGQDISDGACSNVGVPAAPIGTLRLQRSSNGGSTWTTVDTASSARGTTLRNTIEGIDGLDDCVIQSGLTANKTLVDSSGVGGVTYIYRVNYSSWSAFLLSAGTNVLECALTTTQ